MNMSVYGIDTLILEAQIQPIGDMYFELNMRIFPRQVYWSGLSLPPPLISYPIRNNYNCRCEEHFVTIENDTLSSRSQKEKEIKY